MCSLVKGQRKFILVVKSQSKYLAGQHFDRGRRSEYRIYRSVTPLLNAQAQPRKPGIWYTRLPKGLPTCSNFCFLLKEKASRFGYARIENTSMFVECTISLA